MLYGASPFSLWTVVDAIQFNIDEVLWINPSANVCVFWDFKVHHKDWLTYSDRNDTPGEPRYNISISNDVFYFWPWLWISQSWSFRFISFCWSWFLFCKFCFLFLLTFLKPQKRMLFFIVHLLKLFSLWFGRSSWSFKQYS